MVKSISNVNLNKAKTNKKDEFYTQLTDIEKEVRRYKHHFKSLLLLIFMCILKKAIFELY